MNSIQRSAFTLVELLVVIAIIALLAAIVASTFIRAKAAAKDSRCISNLASICHAMQLYANDNDDRPPSCLSRDFTSDHSMPGTSSLFYGALIKYGIGNNSWSCPLASPGWAQSIDAPTYNGWYTVPGVTATLYYFKGGATSIKNFQPPSLTSIPQGAVYLTDPVVETHDRSFKSPHGSQVLNALYFDGHVRVSHLDPG